MRYLFFSFAFLAVGSLAFSASADPGDKEGKKGGDPYAGMREKILKEFDKDGDGKLSDEEREAARGKIRELRIAAAKKSGDESADKGPRREGRPGPGGPTETRERRGDRDERGRDERGEGRRRPPEGRGPEGRGPEARRGGPGRPGPEGRGPEGRGRGPEGRGPEGRGGEARDGEGRRGPGGPGGPPPMMQKPEEMFSKFDKNNDGQLSKEEFKSLTEFVHEHRPGPRLADRSGPPGPPREGRGFGRRGPEDHVFAQRGPDAGPRMRDGDRPRPPRDGEGGSREEHMRREMRRNWETMQDMQRGGVAGDDHRGLRGPGGPDGPPRPPRDGERGPRGEFHRPGGPRGEGHGPRGGEFRREHEDRGHRGEAHDRDDDKDDDDRPARTRDRDRHHEHDDDDKESKA